MSIKVNSDEQLFEHLIQVLYLKMPTGYVSTKTIAEELALSPSQLNRRIKAATGKTASAFMMQLRVDEAKRQLTKFPNISIFEVAHRCGFSDSAHFNHVFHRYEGMAPSQYIQNLQKDREKKSLFIQEQVAKQSIQIGMPQEEKDDSQP
jgi:AraC-like DNA-binding protein